MKMSSYQYRKSHCGDKTVVTSSYLHNVISYTGKITYLYWFGPLVSETVTKKIRMQLSVISVATTRVGCSFHAGKVISRKRLYMTGHAPVHPSHNRYYSMALSGAWIHRSHNDEGPWKPCPYHQLYVRENYQLTHHCQAVTPYSNIDSGNRLSLDGHCLNQCCLIIM